MNRKRMTGFIAGIGMFAFAAGIQAQIMPSTPGRPEAPMDSKTAPQNGRAAKSNQWTQRRAS